MLNHHINDIWIQRHQARNERHSICSVRGYFWR